MGRIWTLVIRGSGPFDSWAASRRATMLQSVQRAQSPSQIVATSHGRGDRDPLGCLRRQTALAAALTYGRQTDKEGMASRTPTNSCRRAAVVGFRGCDKRPLSVGSAGCQTPPASRLAPHSGEAASHRPRRSLTGARGGQCRRACDDDGCVAPSGRAGRRHRQLLLPRLRGREGLADRNRVRLQSSPATCLPACMTCCGRRVSRSTANAERASSLTSDAILHTSAFIETRRPSSRRRTSTRMLTPRPTTLCSGPASSHRGPHMGQRLLTHELTHAVQQSTGLGSTLGLVQRQPKEDQEADPVPLRKQDRENVHRLAVAHLQWERTQELSVEDLQIFATVEIVTGHWQLRSERYDALMESVGLGPHVIELAAIPAEAIAFYFVSPAELVASTRSGCKPPRPDCTRASAAIDGHCLRGSPATLRMSPGR